MKTRFSFTKISLILLLTIMLPQNYGISYAAGLDHSIGSGAGTPGVTSTQDYTDEERRTGTDYTSDEYYNQQKEAFLEDSGYSEDDIESAISGETAQAWGDADIYMEAIGKAYSMVLGMLESTLKITYWPEAEKAAFKDAKAQKKAADKLNSQLDAAGKGDEGAINELNKIASAEQDSFNNVGLEDASFDSDGMNATGSLSGEEVNVSYDKMADNTSKYSNQQQQTMDQAKSDAKSKGETKELTDNCRMIAFATEQVGALLLQAKQTTLSKYQSTNDTDYDQVTTLRQVKQEHLAKKDTATMQSVGWGSTVACYGMMLASGVGSVSMDGVGSIVLKLGAAGVMTAWYIAQIEAHQKYADIVDEMIDAMPKKGDCSAISDRTCYCSLEENQQDAKFCLPKSLGNRTVPPGVIAAPCLDSRLQEDAACLCGSQCYANTSYFNSLENSPFGDNFKRASLSSMKQVTNGYTPGKIGNGYINSNGLAARTKKLLSKYGGKIPSTSGLSVNQQKMVKGLQKLGIPLKAARKFAKMKMGPKGRSYVARARSGAKVSPRFASYRPRKGLKKKSSDVMYFGGKGKKRGRSASRSSGFNVNKFLKKRGKKTATNSSKNSMIRFANMAQKKSQIRKDDGVSIFRIISRRYQVSGRRKLDLE